MIKNYLTIAWRNLIKNKASSLINIGGLAVGMAVAMLIGLWIWDELSFNKNFDHYDHIAIVMQHEVNNGEISTQSNVPFPVGNALRTSYGNDFTNVSMASYNGDHVMELAGKKFVTIPGTYFEPAMLDILSVKMLKGTKNSLTDPSAILLSQSSAKACFGDADPMNRTITMDGKHMVKVAGVYEDVPFNSSFSDVGFIASWELFSNIRNLKKQADPWRCNCYFTYTQLAANADIHKVSASISDLKMKNVNKSELKQKPQLFLEPMSRWHLFSDYKNGVNVGGRIQYVWMFGLIGIFVLLLACINFMNLSTARSEKRAKEVGIRKAIGSLRAQLIYQFLSESLLVVAFAFILSIVLVQLALPFFNEVSGKKISMPVGNPLFWISVLGFSLVTGLISGSYPALYLSSFQPVKVLKGTFRVGRFAAIPRKVLVVLQFTVSVILIIGTVIVFNQIQYAKNRPVGYSRDGLITIGITTDIVHKHFEAIKSDLQKSGAIAGIAESGSPTTAIWSTNAGFDWQGKDPGQPVDFPNVDVSYDYGKTVGWQFKTGRDFSKQFLTDSSAFVINETLAKFIGFKNPVGETIKWDGHPFTVIGVIKDMVTESPYEPVRPQLFHLTDGGADLVILKISPRESTSDALTKIGSVFKTYNPNQPFEYKFVDQDYAKKFGNEERIGKLASSFAILAIFISCLGLFGMASFMAEQRTKEIGVRKVLGATVFGLWQLLSKDFVKLAAIALLIATPIAYYFMHKWLQGYTYRAPLSWWVFALTAAGTIAITLLTVSFQSIKAALANPAKSLKTE